MNDNSILDSSFWELNRMDSKQFNFDITVHEITMLDLRIQGGMAANRNPVIPAIAFKHDPMARFANE
jgi:hypothetical protein